MPVLDTLTHALTGRDVRALRAAASPLATRRRVRSTGRTLDLLAQTAETGSSLPRHMRPPRSVTELASEADAIRELASLLRAKHDASISVVAACDGFADGCWNGAVQGLDHEHHRRQIGRLRFLLLC